MAEQTPPLLSKPFDLLTHQTKKAQWFWLALSLAFAAYTCVLALNQAFASQYVIQEDSRQHIFWMQRYVDAAVFPDDLIADYFQGVAPLGYRWLYKTVSFIGIEPAIFSKLVPTILCLITIFYAYQVTLQLFSLPLAGFITSIGLTQSLWHSSELASATPRAFLYPLLFAFIHHLLQENRFIYSAIIALEALFYPHVALISVGLLGIRLVSIRDRRLCFSQKPQDYWMVVMSLLLAGSIILYTKSFFDFGDVVTRAEAIAMPEFQVEGRSAFFTPGLQFWLYSRSGILHDRTFTPAYLVAGILLPGLLWLPKNELFKQFVTPKQRVLLHLLIISFSLYFLAHLFLFELHLPNRYTSHTLRVVVTLTAGLSWVVILNHGLRVVQVVAQFLNTHLLKNTSNILSQKVIAACNSSLILLLLGMLVLYPLLFFKQFPKVSYDNWEAGKPVYDYLLSQPKDIKIASLSNESSNIPTFAARTVLVSPEHALPYHEGYYAEIRQRVEDLLAAQYTLDSAVLTEAITKYEIDFWLLDNAAFQTAYVAENDWFKQYQPMADNAVQTLTSGEQPILQRSLQVCTTLSTNNWTIADARCIQQIESMR